MFVVFAENGPRKVSGQECFVWRGIPSLADVMSRIGDTSVQGTQIEVGLELPPSRINTYAKGNSTFGSYDGRTITVSHSLAGADTRDPNLRRTMLRMAYDSVCKLYFDIVYGRAEGEYGTSTPD